MNTIKHLFSAPLMLIGKAKTSVPAMFKQNIDDANGIRGPPGRESEWGAMNTTGLLMMGIAMIFIAVGFIVYPIIITGTDAILAYQFSSNASITDASYTGLTAVTGVVPLLILIGLVTAGVVTGFLGAKLQKSGASASLNPTSLLFLAIGVIFIAVGIIIFPVVLDGTSTVLHGGGNGISSDYTGLSAVIGVVPLLVLIAFVSAAVISGFFGVKGATKME